MLKVSGGLPLQHMPQTDDTSESKQALILTLKIMGDSSRSSRALLQGCLATRERHVSTTHSFLVLFDMHWMFALLCMHTNIHINIYIMFLTWIFFFFWGGGVVYTCSFQNDDSLIVYQAPLKLCIYLTADIFNTDSNMAFRKANTNVKHALCTPEEAIILAPTLLPAQTLTKAPLMLPSSKLTGGRWKENTKELTCPPPSCQPTHLRTQQKHSHFYLCRYNTLPSYLPKLSRLTP